MRVPCLGQRRGCKRKIPKNPAVRFCYACKLDNEREIGAYRAVRSTRKQLQ